MSKNKLRKIKVANETFLWKRSHHHLSEYKLSECVEKIVIYLEGCKSSSLQLSFKEEDNLTLKKDPEKEKWCVGYPNTGVIWLFKQPPPSTNDQSSKEQTPTINFNRPAVIAELINYFFQSEWKPKESAKPLVIEDALKFLEIIDLPRESN